MKNRISKIKKFNNQKGFSLLIALLVMAVVLVISLAISYLMIAEVRLVGAYDDAITAYYAADAGIEDALLKIAKGETLSPSGDVYLEDSPTNKIFYNYPQPTTSTNVIPGTLNQDESVEVGMLGDDRPTTVYIDWKDTGTKNCAVEWTLITYKKNGNISLPAGNIDKGFYPGNGVPASYSDSKTGKPSPGIAYFDSSSISLTQPGNYPNRITLTLKSDKTYRYKLRFKCLANTSAGFTGGTYSLSYKITATDGKMTTGGYTIGSTGTANNVKRKIEVQTDVGRHGIIGVFDYVLYSEQPLYKPTITY